MASPLTPKARAALKARAHSLEPVVTIGAHGLTDAVVREIDTALTAHELIKVRAAGDDRQARAQWFDEACERTGASPVGQVGKILILYRQRPVA